MKLAAIDYGTVTTRLLVADVTDRGVEPLLRKTTITHLGEGLALTGAIGSAAVQRICAATREFMSDIVAFVGHECPVTAVATSAMRDAANSAEVLAALSELGINVEIIAGEREAYLSFIGTISGFQTADAAPVDVAAGGSAPADVTPTADVVAGGSAIEQPSNIAGKRVLVVDIGGGSTEVILGSVSSAVKQSPSLLAAHSFNVGSRRVTDMFLHSDPPATTELKQARDWIDAQLGTFFSDTNGKPDMMLAVAGTATAAISIRERMAVYDPACVHASVMFADELAAITTRLATLPEQERQKVVGLQPERASVIVGGLLVLQAVLKVCELPSFIVSESDILQGILLDCYARYHA